MSDRLKNGVFLGVSLAVFYPCITAIAVGTFLPYTWPYITLFGVGGFLYGYGKGSWKELFEGLPTGKAVITREKMKQMYRDMF